eukprot:15158510-Alexandrium_andersonii.AAC.1
MASGWSGCTRATKKRHGGSAPARAGHQLGPPAPPADDSHCDGPQPVIGNACSTGALSSQRLFFRPALADWAP